YRSAPAERTGPFAGFPRPDRGLPAKSLPLMPWHRDQAARLPRYRAHSSSPDDPRLGNGLVGMPGRMSEQREDDDHAKQAGRDADRKQNHDHRTPGDHRKQVVPYQLHARAHGGERVDALI